ncbi:MAG: DUF2142 domain-containing protein [Ruthenibacterium sp.]
MLTFLRKHHHILMLAGIFCTVFLVFGAVRVFALSGLSLKTQTTKFNTVTDAQTVGLRDGESVSQQLSTDRVLYAVSVLPDLRACKGGARLTAQLTDAGGVLLGEGQAELADTGAAEPPYAQLRFAQPVHVPQTADGAAPSAIGAKPASCVAAAPLTLTVTVHLNDADSNDSVRFYTSAEARSGMTALTAAGKATKGSLTLLAETGEVKGFITPFFIVLTLLCACALCAVYAAVFMIHWPVHKVYLTALLCIGLLYALVIPPYGVTDERQHISQAYNNAARILNIAPQESWWGTTVRRTSEHNSVLEENATTVFSYKAVAQGFLSPSPEPFDDAAYYHKAEEVGGYQLPYALSTLGVLLGRLLHLGYVPTLYLARLLNFAFFAAATYWAVKLAPFGKCIFAVAGLLPGTLHVAASFSRDSFTLALAFLFTALALRAAHKGDTCPLHWPEAALLAAVCILLVPAKSVYLPLALLLLLLPVRRFAKAWHAYAYRGGVFALSFAGYWSANRFIVGNAAALGGSPVTAAAANSDRIVYTVPYIFSHLRQFASLLVNSVVEHGDDYLNGLVGGTLGNHNLALSTALVSVFLVLLVLATQCGDGDGILRKARAALPAWLAVLGCGGGAVLGCVLWTPTYYTAIYGLQGRYFLPLLPLLLLLLKPRRAQLLQSSAQALLFALTSVQVCAVLNAFYVIALR